MKFVSVLQVHHVQGVHYIQLNVAMSKRVKTLEDFMHIWILFCSDCQYYLLSSDSELTINRGDKVLVTDMSDKHMWKGTVYQNEGWFPSWVFDSNRNLQYVILKNCQSLLVEMMR